MVIVYFYKYMMHSLQLSILSMHLVRNIWFTVSYYSAYYTLCPNNILLRHIYVIYCSWLSVSSINYETMMYECWRRAGDHRLDSLNSLNKTHYI